MSSVTPSQRNPRSGMSLTQLLVVAAVLATIIAAIGSSINNMFKASKTLDVRSQAQSFENLLNLNMGNSASCRAAFGIQRDGTGKLINADASNTDQKWRVIPTSQLPSATNTTLAEVTVSVLQLSGSRFVFDGTQIMQDLKLQNLVLKFKSKPLPETPDIYPASLIVTLGKTSAKSSLGGEQVVRSVELSLQMLDHAASGGKQIADCYSVLGGQNSPEKTCEDLGGRWLRATQPGTYMPVERCTMAGELTLGLKEAPDGVPLTGETSTSGERIETCGYQASGSPTVKTWTCQGYSGTMSGYRCAWNASAREWWVVYYLRGVARTTPYQRCTKGVKVSLKPSDSTSLFWDTPLSGDAESPFTVTNPDPFLDYADRLEAPIRCYPYADRTTPLDCKNNFADALAPMGGSGACVYVKGIRLNGTSAAQLAAFDADGHPPPAGITNYTGWIWVNSARNWATYAATNPKRLMSEARGKACYQIDIAVDETAFSRPQLSDPRNDAPQTMQSTYPVLADPSIVAQCYYKATSSESVIAKLLSPSAEAIRSTLIPCTNSFAGLDPPSSADDGYKEWTGEVGSNPTMNKGSCWYVKNTKVGTYHKGTGAATLLTAPVAAGWAGDTSKYTGWVYLTADLADGKFRIDPTDMSLVPAAAANSLTAVPCNQGVRVKTSP